MDRQLYQGLHRTRKKDEPWPKPALGTAGSAVAKRST
jgi:hypothetical protein